MATLGDHHVLQQLVNRSGSLLREEVQDSVVCPSRVDGGYMKVGLIETEGIGA